MHRSQLGICAEITLHSWVLLFDITTDQVLSVRTLLKRFPSLSEELAKRFSEANLSCVLAIGANYWRILSQTKPRELSTSPSLPALAELLPLQNADLAILIHSDRADSNFFAAQTFRTWLETIATLEEDWQGLRYLDGRSLFGFKAPLNVMPHGKKRRDWALLSSKTNREFGGGSYLWLQKNYLDLGGWHQLSTEQQREIMGCEKVSGEPLVQMDKKTHLSSTQVGAEQGQEKRVWRVQMPMIDLQMPTEFILNWSHSLKDIERLFATRYGLAQAAEEPLPNESFDPLLEYETPSAQYILFAPSLSWLEAL